MTGKLLLIVTLLFTSVSVSQTDYGIPQTGIKGFWPFSGNTNDVSGNNLHGKPFGVKPARDRFGNNNGAYYFNGVSNIIYTPYEGILGNHPRAISFWALVHNNKRGKSVISYGSNNNYPNDAGRFDCSFGGCFTCDSTEKEQLGCTFEASDAGITYEPHDVITDGKWHHYVWQFDKKLVKDVEIYQDGRLLTHTLYYFYKDHVLDTKKDINVTFGALIVNKDTISHFKGYLDDVVIYDRALTGAEIQSLYKAPDPHKKINIFKWLPEFLLLLGLGLLIFWFIRLRVKKLVEKEKEKIQLEKNWYEQENRVLKAQMDPHFIFNALNSIQQFIIVNDNEKAQLYLSTFAQLIRMQLESNTNETITLKQEIVILEKYLEIESLRFNNVFDHEIIVDKSIDTGIIFIPYFLVQPFVENAIHHGLLPKIGYKELTITFEMPDPETLVCTVDDNGIGRANSGLKETPFKTKSLGVNFVEQRLLIMSKMDKKKYGVQITDKVDADGSSAGMRVCITMPIQKKP